MITTDRPIDSAFDKGLITAISVPFWTRPGFAIPLIQLGLSSNTVYIQSVDRSRKVNDFIYVECFSLDRRVPATYTVEIGQAEVYALLDIRGRICIGTQKELSPDVSRWVEEIKAPLVRFSFARFCGSRSIEFESAS